jgi:hypothetical protein
MAVQEEPLLADLHKLQIKDDGTYKTVAFITNLSISRSKAERAISSFNDCTNNSYRPSRNDRTLSGTAYIYNGTENGLAHSFMEGLFDNNTEFDFRIIPLDCAGDPLVGEIQREGEGFFTQLDDNHDLGESSSYTFTIRVKGAFDTTVVPTPPPPGG